MPVKALEFLSVEGRRFPKVANPSNMNIGINQEITLVTELNDKEINVEFRFSLNYTGNTGLLGMVKFEGHLLYEGKEAGSASEIASEWGINRKLPDDVTKEITFVMMKDCLMESVVIANDLKLPPPFPLPQVKVGQSPQKVAPDGGIEVA